MKKSKRLILIVLCVLMLLCVGGFAACRAIPYWQHRAQVFGHSFGTSLNLYANVYANYVIEHPAYCVNDNGILCLPDSSTRENGFREIGKLTPFKLTEDNFDNCMTGGHWTAYGMDASVIREHTLNAWKCLDSDGSLYYLIFQENGDVFLAMGQQTDEVSIFNVFVLNNIGDENVFLDYYKE